MSRSGVSARPPAGLRSVRTPLLIAGALLCAAGAILIAQAERSVFGRVPILDEVWYLDRAAELTGAAPRDPVAEPYFMSPLYPVLIAATGAGGGVPADRVFDGGALRGLRAFQWALWLGTAVLLAVLAARAAPASWRGRTRLAGVGLPVVLFCLYRPAAVYALAVLVEIPLVFLLTLAAVLLTGAGVAQRRPVALLALGATLGLAGLLRGTALLLVPVAVAAVLVRGHGTRARTWPALVWLLLGLAVVGAPPTWRNSRLAGHLVGPTVNAGLNLYIGNGPEANGFYVAAVPGDWRRDPAGRAFLAGRFGRDAVSLAEADRLWRDAALAEMRARPGRTAALFLRKLWLHVQGWEIDQLTPLAGWTRTVPLLRGWLVPYALLVVLGSAGLAAAWGRSDGGVLRWALAVLVVLLLGQSLFFVVSRYRLALVPFWCVAAGWGAVHLAARRRAAWVAAALAAVLVVPWGLNGVRATWSGLAAANEALRWADVGVATGDASALERAVALYREAVAVAPDRTPSWLGLAAALGARGDESGRRTVLREGARQASDPVPLWRALLGAALAGNDPVAAREAAEQVLVRDPDDAEALHNLAVLLARTGDPAAALAAARRLRAAHPADARGYIDEGVILARAGRRDEARAVFRAGLERLPDDPALRRNLALVSD